MDVRRRGVGIRVRPHRRGCGFEGARRCSCAVGAVGSHCPTRQIIYDRGTRRSKGFGFVTFANSEHAQVAIETMHLTSLGGRVVKVSHADPIGTAPRRSVPRPPPGQAQPGAYAYPAAGMQGSYAPPPPPFGYAPPATGYVQAAPAAASGAPVAYTVDAAASTAHFHGSPVVSESLSPTHHAPPVGYATGMGVTTPKAAAAVGFPMVAIPSSPAGPVAQHGPGSPMSGGSPMGYQPVVRVATALCSRTPSSPHSHTAAIVGAVSAARRRVLPGRRLRPRLARGVSQREPDCLRWSQPYGEHLCHL